MAKVEVSSADRRYPVRVAARMTGLKPELIRAWEMRYEAVSPERTAGRSRRYSDHDLHRLTLLRDLVAAGHRISRIAQLDVPALQNLLMEVEPQGGTSKAAEIIRVARTFDTDATQRLVSELMRDLGPAEFATEIGVPLLIEIGELWERGDLSVSVEHFTTSIVRAALVAALAAIDAPMGGPRIVFATPSGEPHDLGSLIAAIAAAKAGARVVFLGADVPFEDLVGAVESSRADAIALGLVTLPEKEAANAITEVRAAVSKRIDVLIGGAGIKGLPPIKDVQRTENLDQLEAQVAHLMKHGGESSSAVSMRSWK